MASVVTSMWVRATTLKVYFLWAKFKSKRPLAMASEIAKKTPPPESMPIKGIMLGQVQVFMTLRKFHLLLPNMGVAMKPSQGLLISKPSLSWDISLFFFLDDTKEFIVNVVADTLRIIIIKIKLENNTRLKYVLFTITFKLWLVLFLSTEILIGMVQFHIISWLYLHLNF